MSRAAALKTAAMFLALAVVVEIWPSPRLDAQGRSEAVGPPGGFAWTVAAPPGRPADGHVFAGVTGGVLRSLDGGDSWHEAAAASFVPALAVSPDFENDLTIFAGTSGEGILRSTNGGESWESAGEGLTDLNVEVVTFSPAYEADRTVFAGTFGAAFSAPRTADTLGAPRAGGSRTTPSSPSPYRPVSGRTGPSSPDCAAAASSSPSAAASTRFLTAGYSGPRTGARLGRRSTLQ